MVYVLVYALMENSLVMEIVIHVIRHALNVVDRNRISVNNVLMDSSYH